MNAQIRLEHWFHRLEEPSAQMMREDACFLMVQARHLIEAAADPDNYRVAAFYADWTVHTALDRSPVSFQVLRDVTRVLAENASVTKANVTRDVSRVIGFPRLRSELSVLFRENGLPTVLCDYRQNWHAFVAFLLWCIAGQPIRFPEAPNARARAILDEIHASARPRDLMVDALAVVERQGVYHWHLAVSLDDGQARVTIMGQVEIAEDPDTFLTPPEQEPASEPVV